MELIKYHMNQNRITKPVRLLVERTRREMNLNGSLRFNPGGNCSEGGATTLPHWDHWQIIHRQPRQRYHTARWTYFYWVQQDKRLYCRQKDFRFYFKDKTTELTPEIQERILNGARRRTLDLLLFGGRGGVTALFRAG